MQSDNIAFCCSYMYIMMVLYLLANKTDIYSY